MCRFLQIVIATRLDPWVWSAMPTEDNANVNPMSSGGGVISVHQEHTALDLVAALVNNIKILF